MTGPRASALSGLLWGACGFGVLLPVGHDAVWGLAASPFIGLVVGFISSPLRTRSEGLQMLWALYTLLLSAACFGAVSGGAVGIVVVFWGLSFVIWALVPLAWLNHQMIWRRELRLKRAG